MPLPSWTPELATLDLLLAVAELGSLGRAAAERGISQPSVSARLARLERQVGAPLLVRTARGSGLTAAGEAVVAWARDVVTAAQAMNEGIVTLRADRAARLRVAASLTVAEYLAPKWLLTLRRRHPDLESAVTVANSSAVCDLVRAGQVDVGFVEAPQAPANVSSQVVGRDRIALVVAADYPLAGRPNGTLRARELVDQPVLLREPGSGTRDTFLLALASRLGEPQSVLPHAVELGSTAMIVATALAGGGIGVISARAAAAEIATGRLVELHVEEMTIERPLRAVWSNGARSPLADELVEIAITSTDWKPAIPARGPRGRSTAPQHAG